MDQNKNPGRPFDTAVSDDYHTGNDLLWKKHMGDQEKPKNWNMYLYPWYFTQPKRRGKRRTSAINELLTFSWERSCVILPKGHTAPPGGQCQGVQVPVSTSTQASAQRE